MFDYFGIRSMSSSRGEAMEGHISGACHDKNYWGGNSNILESEKVGGPHTPSEARRIRGREAPEKKRGVRGSSPGKFI